METSFLTCDGEHCGIILYSLEKLIEWKLRQMVEAEMLTRQVLYSLEKLIEWKL